MSEQQKDNVDTSTYTLDEWINKGKHLLEEITLIKSELIDNSHGKLNDLNETIAKLKQEYINKGEEGIIDKINNAKNKITTILERTKKIAEFFDIDISDCIAGKEIDLEKLGQHLFEEFATVANKIINNAIENVENSLKTVSVFLEEISRLPEEFRSSFISWHPIDSVSECVQRINDLLATIPGKISQIVSEMTTLINTLPNQLLKCVTEAVEHTENEALNILISIATGIGIKFGNATKKYLLE